MAFAGAKRYEHLEAVLCRWTEVGFQGMGNGRGIDVRLLTDL